MDFREYRAIDAVNWSRAKAMRTSPLAYKSGLNALDEDTPRLALGRAVHTSVFEPDRFALEYAVFTGPRRSGKVFEAFCDANRGRTILREDEYEECLAMRNAVRSHPVAGPLLTPPGKAEMVLIWTDPQTEIQCKCRIDWWRPGLLADLKTARTVDARKFAISAHELGYFGQMGFYRRALEASGLDVPRPRFIVVEASLAHDVAVFSMTDEAIEAAEVEVDEVLARIAAGRFSGMWPGRYPEEMPLDLPAWAYGSDTDAAGLGLTFAEREE